MTIETLLDYMEDFDNELQTDDGEVDEERGLDALNMAQDLFEMVIAGYKGRMLQTYTTFTTTANQEYTTKPTGLLRLDELWLMDTSVNRPSRKLELIDETGGHAIDGLAPLTLTASSVVGAPREYTIDSTRFNWRPVPDAEYTVRAYGFIRAANFDDRDDTFAYDDAVAIPLAILATKILAVGVGDATGELMAAAEEAFVPTLKALDRIQRVKPPSRYYSRTHTT